MLPDVPYGNFYAGRLKTILGDIDSPGDLLSRGASIRDTAGTPNLPRWRTFCRQTTD
jgi:hypothetical protein